MVGDHSRVTLLFLGNVEIVGFDFTYYREMVNLNEKFQTCHSIVGSAIRICSVTLSSSEPLAAAAFHFLSYREITKFNNNFHTCYFIVALVNDNCRVTLTQVRATWR